MTQQSIARSVQIVRDLFDVEIDPGAITPIGGKGFYARGKDIVTGEEVIFIQNGTWPVKLSLDQFDNLLRGGHNMLHLSNGACNG